MLATDLAKAGITAARGAVESVFGQILSTRFDPDGLTQKLGEDYYISKNYFKMYSCCRYNHAALDAIQLILAEELLTDDQIAKIEVETYGAAAALKEQQPANMLAAKFSVPFALAAYIVLGNAGVEAFSDKSVQNERIRHLALRINLSENPAFTAMLPQNRPARVTVYLKDGRTAERAVSSSQGGFDNPYPESMLLDKFGQLAEGVVGNDAAKQIISLCQALDELKDVQELTCWLKPSLNNRNVRDYVERTGWLQG